jgi:DNA-binding TFAR19-related protein (PDSD5 family)
VVKKPPAFSGELKTHTMKTPSIRRYRKQLLPKLLSVAARARPRTVRIVRTARNFDQKSVSSFVVYARHHP